MKNIKQNGKKIKEKKVKLIKNLYWIYLLFVMSLFLISCIIEYYSINNNILQITRQTLAEIEYANNDVIQSPEQTENLKSGDCEDIVILAMYRIYKKHSIKTKLSAWKLENGNYHAVLEYNGFYEYEYYTEYLGTKIASFDYDYIMSKID